MALEITTGAFKISPWRNLTPATLPDSTKICSTWAFNRNSPPQRFKPRTSASTIASLPPTGYSTPARERSPNIKATSGAIVPWAFKPESRKHSKSINRRTQGSRTSRSITCPTELWIEPRCGSIFAKLGKYRSKTGISCQFDRKARVGIPCKASYSGNKRWINRFSSLAPAGVISATVSR